MNKPVIPNFVVDIEMSLTPEELALLKRAADQVGKTIEEMARTCIVNHCNFSLANMEKKKTSRHMPTDQGYDAIG